MQLCFDATRFGFGLKEAVEFAAQKNLKAIEYAVEPFSGTSKGARLSVQEKKHLSEVRKLCESTQTEVSLITLKYSLDAMDKAQVKQFDQMVHKLALLAESIGCKRLAFFLKPSIEKDFAEIVGKAIEPLISDLSLNDLKLILSLSTAHMNRGSSLKYWRPLDPQEWRDIVAHSPGLGLSFSAADCLWQNIDYLKILPGLIPAIEHVEAYDVEVNRAMLVDSGLFGPLWWRYRRPGKGHVDWAQLIEALKLYDYQGSFSIHLEDEFAGDTHEALEDTLDESVKLLTPLLKY